MLILTNELHLDVKTYRLLLQVNKKIDEALIKKGYGTIVIKKSQGAKHSLGVGILNISLT